MQKYLESILCYAMGRNYILRVYSYRVKGGGLTKFLLPNTVLSKLYAVTSGTGRTADWSIV